MPVASIDITGDRAAMEAAIARCSGKTNGVHEDLHNYWRHVQRTFRDPQLFGRDDRYWLWGGRHCTFGNIGDRAKKTYPADHVVPPSKYPAGTTPYGYAQQRYIKNGATYQMRSTDFRIDTSEYNPVTRQWASVVDDKRYTLNGLDLQLAFDVEYDISDPNHPDYVGPGSSQISASGDPLGSRDTRRSSITDYIATSYMAAGNEVCSGYRITLLQVDDIRIDEGQFRIQAPYVGSTGHYIVGLDQL